jgi:hypothetical protein
MGFLIENFSRLATPMSYNRPYYQRLIEESSLSYAKIVVIGLRAGAYVG